jgi:hypothetical protein
MISILGAAQVFGKSFDAKGSPPIFMNHNSETGANLRELRIPVLDMVRHQGRRDCSTLLLGD